MFANNKQTVSWLCRSAMHWMAIALLVALPAASVRLFFAYQHETKQVRAQLEEIRVVHVPQLLDSLRHGSHEKTEKLLKKMIELPDMMFVEIRSDRKKSLAESGISHSQGIVMRRYPLPISSAPSLSIPSALHVAVSLSGVHSRIKYQAWPLFFGPGLAVFTAIFILAALYCQNKQAHEK